MNFFNFFSRKTFFNESSEIANQNTVSDDNFESNKSRSAYETNKTISTLNTNNDLISSIRLAYEKGVVGSQIPIQMRTKDENFNNSYEKLLRKWSKLGNCEITGRFYRGLAERVLINYAKIQGGFLIRHHYNKKWEIPYKFEILSLHLIDRTQDMPHSNIFNGIKINNNGQIIGIYIYKDSEKTFSKLVDYKNLTLFLIPWVDSTQYTGLSPLSPIIATFDLLGEYTQAELKSAKRKSEENVLIKTHLFNEILRIRKDKAKSQGNKNPTEQEIAEIYAKFKINGSIRGANYIPVDDEVFELRNNADSIFENLDNANKKTISSGAGLSTQTTFREMPSSYNAALLNSKLDDEQFDIDFTDFTELVWREVIEVRLLDALVLSGKLKVKDYWENRENYQEIEFIRKSTSHIDPAKVQLANKAGLENGTLNSIDIISSNGKDWQSHIRKEIIYELEREKIKQEMYKKAGIKLEEEDENATD